MVCVPQGPQSPKCQLCVLASFRGPSTAQRLREIGVQVRWIEEAKRPEVLVKGGGGAGGADDEQYVVPSTCLTEDDQFCNPIYTTIAMFEGNTRERRRRRRSTPSSMFSLSPGALCIILSLSLFLRIELIIFQVHQSVFSVVVRVGLDIF